MKKFAIIGAAVAALVTSQVAMAESDVNSPAPANGTASARLDFQVTIPRVLFLQVGTGTAMQDGATIDQISFTVPAANVADGTNVAGTGGDLGSGGVTVRLFGNGGDISLAATSNGGANLSNGTDTIPWTEFLVTEAAGAGGAGFVGTAITHPTINGAAVTVTATNKVVRQHATWTFAFDNSQAYAAGTYGGVNTNNSRITYTATLP